MTLHQATATKPVHLSSIPRIYMVEGEKPRQQGCKLSSDLHIGHSVHDVFIGFTYRRVGEELPTGMWVTPKQPYH